MISFVEFKDAIIEAAHRPSNIAEDGSVIWNFVESDLFIEGVMTEELRPAFNTIVDGFISARKCKSMKDLAMDIEEAIVDANGERSFDSIAKEFGVTFDDVVAIAETLEEV